MKSKIILSLIGMFILFHSCISVFREVTCRDFEFEEELKWYPGVVGDAVVIAPEIGIVELTEASGTVWINTDLKTKLNIELSSFAYSEDTCEGLPE